MAGFGTGSLGFFGWSMAGSAGSESGLGGLSSRGLTSARDSSLG